MVPRYQLSDASGDPALLRDFEAGSVAPDAFHHPEHVHVTWLLLQRYPALEALRRVSDGLRRLTAAHGLAEKYHETITWAYTLLILERMERGGRDQDWETFAASNPDLLGKGRSILSAYYQADTLNSDLARSIFLLPDRRTAQLNLETE